MTAADGPHLVHAALLHGSAEELTAAAVPFLAEGLAAGETAVLACSEEHNTLLGRALGSSGRVLRLPREEIYTGDAHALATYRRLVRRQAAAGVPGLRLVGSLPFGRRTEREDEWHRYEAVLNVAMAGMPMSAVCAYDRREIPDRTRDGVEQTHPLLLTPTGFAPNDRYLEPVTVLRRTPARVVGAVPDRPPTVHLDGVTDAARLPELRARVRAALEGRGRHEQVRRRFAAAVAEVLGNAFRHGVPPVAVEVWTTPTRLTAAVTDRGPGFDDPLAGYLPPGTGSSAAAGLWAARQACDALETVRTPSGFTVRLTTALPARDGGGPVAAADPAAARAEARALVRRLRAGSGAP